MNSSSNNRMDALLGDVVDYLSWQREEGATELDVTPETLAMLKRKPEAAPLPMVPSPESLEEIAHIISTCKKCGLCNGRTKTVPGQGATTPDIMFVGEGPGADEDKQGLAFVGRAGKLLTQIIEAMGLTRDEVFIANIVKCRPPGNRVPTPEEMAACMPYLKQQIALLKPRILITLGATAAKGLLNSTEGISRLRGAWHAFEDIDVMPTYHPAYLLRNPSAKHDVWDDMQEALKKLGRKPPPRKK